MRGRSAGQSFFSKSQNLVSESNTINALFVSQLAPAIEIENSHCLLAFFYLLWSSRMPLITSIGEDLPQNHVHIAVLDTDVPCPAVYAKRGMHSSRFRVLLQAAAERLNQDTQKLKHGNIGIHVTAFDVVGGSYPPLSFLRSSPRSLNRTNSCDSPGPIDVILVTGAAAAAYDDLPWIPALRSFIQTVYADHPFVKIYGSCFGHQLIGQALLEGQECSMGKDFPSKISVEPSVLGHEIGVHPIVLNSEFSRRFLTR